MIVFEVIVIGILGLCILTLGLVAVCSFAVALVACVELMRDWFVR